MAAHYGVKWRAIKFASDLADGSAAEQWNDLLEVADQKINEEMDSALDL